MPHPTDGSVWYTVGVFAGAPGFLRFDPKTKLSRDLRRAEGRLRHPRRRHRQERRALGLGLERHLVSFDRRKCKGPLNGPSATGNHCPEGLALLQISRARVSKAIENNSAEASYYTWVDQHNTVGSRRERSDLHRQPQ